MMLPGANLLRQAMRMFATQTLSYQAYVSRTASANGFWTATYAAPVTVQGMVQPVPLEMYETLGLNMKKIYYRVYLPQAASSVGRDSSGDQITFNSLTLQVESQTNWSAIDGWTELMCVQVQLA